MNGQNISCIFCGNPRPNILRELQEGTQTGFSLRGLISRNRQRFQVVSPTPLVNCLLCNRRYYLFAVEADREFVEYFLNNHVLLTTHVVDSIIAFGLPPSELVEYVIGIAQPENSRNLIYIVILYSNKRYFISCKKYTGSDPDYRGKYLALNADKVVIE